MRLPSPACHGESAVKAAVLSVSISCFLERVEPEVVSALIVPAHMMMLGPCRLKLRLIAKTSGDAQLLIERVVDVC
jgi:hypothetical protein